MIRRQRDSGRIVTLRIGQSGRLLEERFVGQSVLRFVRDRVVEHGEERLIRLALAPMRLAAASVPSIFRDREVVVGLRVVRAVVARVAEILREAFDAIRQSCLRTHVMGTDRRAVAAGDNARPIHGTNAGDPVRVGVSYALLGQAVDRRRVGVLVTPASEIGAHILASDPENVRTLCVTRIGRLCR